MYGSQHRAHHHYPNEHHRAVPAVAASSPEGALAADIFEKFIAASTFKSALHHYRHICDVLKLRPTNFKHFYPKLKNKIRSWKAQQLWTKFDKRASHKWYNHGKAGLNSRVLIIGAGPCGLRTAIEAQLLGAKVVLIEKRDRFSRNNVLHLWPFVISDLKALGAKKFYGKFCAGAIDHISIRQLQCILLKVALLLGVEIIEAVTFEELLEPPEDQSQRVGWHARFSPADHPVNQYEFDVLVNADGKRNTLTGFKRKEFRGKLAIAITANFINRHTEQEACVQEISGVAFIFNQKFFKDLNAETGIDLENIVYYKDETHYFVMTAKKHSLINKGVILQDFSDTQELLHPRNVDRDALCAYAREAADFSTNYLLPHTDFAVNHYGKPDIAMFDFTSMFAAENACKVLIKNGHKLLQCLVGDSLLEPFWPTGSGCARGFLSSFDACWAIRSWSSAMTPTEVVAERESIYRLLAQTTPENLAKDIAGYTLDPQSRYPTINLRAVLPFQVRHLVISDDSISETNEPDSLLSDNHEEKRKRKRKDSTIHPETLLQWCQKELEDHSDVPLEDLSASLKDGRALCAIIHRYYPYLLDFDSILQENVAENNQLAFDILENEFGISPVMSGSDMAHCDCPDQQIMIHYMTQVHDVFRGKIPQLKIRGKNERSYDFEDVPTPHKNEPTRPLGRPETSRSEGNLLKCKMSDSKENFDSIDDLPKMKKRKNESGSLSELNKANNRSAPENSEDFNDKVKELEARFKNPEPNRQKPKDMIRAIGKLEKTDWNLAAIEQKMLECKKPIVSTERERVPKWNLESFNDKHHNFEQRLRENGEDEQRIAKFLDIDASLKRLERKLKEGSTLETGLRGHNKVSNLANQLSSKLTYQPEKKNVTSKQSRPMVLSTSSNDLCHVCKKRVYLAERLSAEGKFFHRTCFKCCYCNALLRLGNYIYEREGRFGGQYFCIPHYGMMVKPEAKATESPVLLGYNSKVQPTKISGSAALLKTPPPNSVCQDNLYNPNLASFEDRGATPERAEFENTVVEQSDEEEYLSEEEWTDRNFGMSANELDESDSDSDSSELSDEEVDDFETDFKISADETRRLAETWKRRFSTDNLDSDGSKEDKAYDSDQFTEHGADGDESRTATEGEDDGDDDEDEVVQKAREVRRQELNINFKPPTHHSESSESGSETEMGSDGEDFEESATQIDTDSEFGDDNQSNVPKEVPKIIIHEDELEIKETHSYRLMEKDPKPEYIDQVIDISNPKQADPIASEYSIILPVGPNPHTEHLKRLLQRTESTEAVTAKWNPQAMQTNLRGNVSNFPKKSASSTDLGNRFQSFMEKISATQKKLNPAPEPSPAMQAFLSASSKNSSTPYVLPTKKDTPVLEMEPVRDGKSSQESTASPQLEDGNLFVFPVAETNSPINASSDLPMQDVFVPENFDVTMHDKEQLEPKAQIIEEDEMQKAEPIISSATSTFESVNPMIDTSSFNHDSYDNSLDLTSYMNASGVPSSDGDIDIVFDKLAGEALDDFETTNISIFNDKSHSNSLNHVDQNCNLEEKAPGLITKVDSIDNIEVLTKQAESCESTNNNDTSHRLGDDDEDELLKDWAEDYVVDAGEENIISDSPRKNKTNAGKSLSPAASNEIIETHNPNVSMGPVLDDLQNIDFMDTSESESSEVDSQFSDSKQESSSIQEKNNHSNTQSERAQNGKSDHETSGIELGSASMEKSSSFAEESSSVSSTPKRYEGYIPRFKDRVTPFRYVRDSIDVRKSASSKPLFTPSREDIIEREKNQSALITNLSSVEEKAQDQSSSTPFIAKSIEPKKLYTSTPKPTDRDLVRDMVLSRINVQNKRRGSRGSLTSLNSSGVSSNNTSASFVTAPLPLQTSMTVADIPSASADRLETNYLPPSPNRSRSKLPDTPLTHPEKFPVAPATNVQIDECLECDTLEEDSHLLNRNVSKRLHSDNYLINDRTRRASVGEIDFRSRLQPCSFSSADISITPSEPPKLRHDKDSRLKQLLAEHRRKESQSPKDSRNDEHLDLCIRECLEEYRQKRLSEPLSLEKLATFDTTDSTVSSSSPLNLLPEDNKACLVAHSSNKPPEPRKKKSKDRERRRSLIQVVAGMFNKSDDSKKEDRSSPEKKEVLSPATSSSPDSFSSPKSPTVMERFSRLRITRSSNKQKNKEAPDRSQSADGAAAGSSSRPTSLPSTPSRTIFSFLSNKTVDKKASSPSGQTNAIPPAMSSHTISRIQEENVTDEENLSGHFNTPKDASLQTPSTRRQKAALRAAKQAQHKRHRVAQEIQRQLEECEVKAKELEDRSIRVQKALDGKSVDNTLDKNELLTMWYEVMQEKNALKRWQQELTVKAKEVQLEDQHRRLEDELRQRMGCLESEKSRTDIDREGEILNQMLEILDQKDSLVALLEENRLRYMEEDRDLKALMGKQGLFLPNDLDIAI